MSNALRLKLADDTTRKPPSKFRFTAAGIGKVKAPTKGRRYVYDTGEPGLAMMVTHTGSRSWYFYRKVDGRPMRLKLGNVADISIEQGRKLTRQYKGAIAEGKDPSEERRVKRGELTLNELWRHYQDEHAATNCTEKTQVAEASLYDGSLRKTLGRRKLSSIRPADVKALHGDISKRGKTTANRAIQIVRRLYRFAAAQYDLQLPPPTASVKMNAEASRERFMTEDEVRRFFTALEHEGLIWRDFFKVCAFTGARRGNVQSMRWDALDLAARKWTIPGSEFKNRTTTVVELPDEAVAILIRRRDDADDGAEYVFPPQRIKIGKDGITTRHISQPTTVWRRIIARTGIKDLRMHDLRRTKGSWMASAGASLSIIGAALGHKDHRATQIYARVTPEAVRTHADAAASAMGKAMKPKPKKKKKKEKEKKKGGKAKKKTD